MGRGRVWARKFEFGENPFLGKNVFYFWGKLTPKMHAHLVIHPRSPFSSPSETWELFYLHDFSCCVFSLTIWGSWAFFSSSVTHVGALSKWLGVLCVWILFLGLLCVFYLTWEVVYSFSSCREFCFCDDLCLGFFPNVFVAFSPLISKLKIVFALPNNLEERPRFFGCWWIRFWPR